MGKSEYTKILEAKRKAKIALVSKSWAGSKPTEPLVVIFAHQKDEKLLFQLLEGCLILPGHFIVVCDSEPGDHLKKPTGKITFVNPEDGRNKPRIDQYMEAADMAVLFEEHMHSLEDVMKKGVVIIGHEKSPFLNNYHPNEETGNSFTFESKNPWTVFMALVRANETYRFPYDWGNIVRGILKTDFK
jgi:hypothetical protein